MPNEFKVVTSQNFKVVCLISASTEWKALKSVWSCETMAETPYGECFHKQFSVEGGPFDIVFLHGGVGKIDAAASGQYAISRWTPQLVMNLGTCGGFRGLVNISDIALVQRAVVYDLIERMYDPDELIEH